LLEDFDKEEMEMDETLELEEERKRLRMFD